MNTSEQVAALRDVVETIDEMKVARLWVQTATLPARVAALTDLCDEIGMTLDIHTPKNVVAAYEQCIAAGEMP